jgi:hypothetical protein
LGENIVSQACLLHAVLRGPTSLGITGPTLGIPEFPINVILNVKLPEIFAICKLSDLWHETL